MSRAICEVIDVPLLRECDDAYRFTKIVDFLRSSVDLQMLTLAHVPSRDLRAQASLVDGTATADGLLASLKELGKKLYAPAAALQGPGAQGLNIHDDLLYDAWDSPEAREGHAIAIAKGTPAWEFYRRMLEAGSNTRDVTDELVLHQLDNALIKINQSWKYSHLHTGQFLQHKIASQDVKELGFLTGVMQERSTIDQRRARELQKMRERTLPLVDKAMAGGCMITIDNVNTNKRNYNGDLVGRYAPDAVSLTSATLAPFEIPVAMKMTGARSTFDQNFDVRAVVAQLALVHAVYLSRQKLDAMLSRGVYDPDERHGALQVDIENGGQMTSGKVALWEPAGSPCIPLGVLRVSTTTLNNVSIAADFAICARYAASLAMENVAKVPLPELPSQAFVVCTDHEEQGNWSKIRYTDYLLYENDGPNRNVVVVVELWHAVANLQKALIFDELYFSLLFADHFGLVAPKKSRAQLAKSSSYNSNMQVIRIATEAFKQAWPQIRAIIDGATPTDDTNMLITLGHELVPVIEEFQIIWRRANDEAAERGLLRLIRAAEMLGCTNYVRDLLRMYHEIFVVLKTRHPVVYAGVMRNRNRTVGVICELYHRELGEQSASHTPKTAHYAMLVTASMARVRQGFRILQRAAGGSTRRAHAYETPPPPGAAAQPFVNRMADQIVRRMRQSIPGPDKEPQCRARETSTGTALVDTEAFGAKQTYIRRRKLLTAESFNEQAVGKLAESLMESQKPLHASLVYYGPLYDSAATGSAEGWIVKESQTPPEPEEPSRQPLRRVRVGERPARTLLADEDLVSGAEVYLAVSSSTGALSHLKVHSFVRNGEIMATDGEEMRRVTLGPNISRSSQLEYRTYAIRQALDSYAVESTVRSPGAVEMGGDAHVDSLKIVRHSFRRRVGGDGEVIEDPGIGQPGPHRTFELSVDGEAAIYHAFADDFPLSQMLASSLRYVYAETFGQHPGSKSAVEMRRLLYEPLMKKEALKIASGGNFGPAEWLPPDPEARSASEPETTDGGLSSATGVDTARTGPMGMYYAKVRDWECVVRRTVLRHGGDYEFDTERYLGMSLSAKTDAVMVETARKVGEEELEALGEAASVGAENEVVGEFTSEENATGAADALWIERPETDGGGIADVHMPDASNKSPLKRPEDDTRATEDPRLVRAREAPHDI